MTAKKNRRRPQSRRPDLIERFADTMRVVHERDQALKEVVGLRDAGKLREARAKFKQAEKLHARAERMQNEILQ